MSERWRIFSLICIMAVVGLVATGIAVAMLYRAALYEERVRLVETAQSRARLIEAVARFDAVYSHDYPEGPVSATISQIVDAHERFEGFGETGEFTLARLEGDQMVFLLSHRHHDPENYGLEKPEPVPFDSDLAEPMRLALSGLSGAIVGLDYRGEVVLAAHEPVAELDLGIVAKIDLSEIRAPFIKAAGASMAAGLVLLIIGVILFLRISDPIIRRLRITSKRLGRLVDERTSELAKANETLKAEVEERRRSEESVREQARLLDLIFEQTLEGMALMDRDFNFIRVSESYARASNNDPSFFPGKNHFDIFHSTFREEVEPFVREKKVYKCQGRPFVYPDDPERGVTYWDVGLVPILGKDEEVEFLLLTLKDRTEERRAEEALQKTQKLESLGVLAGGIAHDFNNMLTGVTGNLSLIKHSMGPSDENQKRLNEIEKSTFRARELTRQLLTFSKGGKPVKETVSVGELLEEAARFVLRGKGVKCEISAAEDLRAVRADAGQLTQVINNLLINASQAMDDKGTITIEARNVTIDADSMEPLKEGRYVLVSIKDQGAGILKQHLKKIFDPYFTTRDKGSGLGLSSAYSIIKNHGGYIDVETEPEIGTTFHIYLPATDITARVGAPEDRALVRGRGRVLVMDDEEIIRDVVGEILSHLGYEPGFAKDGEEAVELYSRAASSGEPFDAVIMDLTIPGGMGGKEAVAEILKIDPEARVIVSSGYSEDPIMSDFEKYGFSGVIAKPYRVEDLSEKLQALVANPFGA